MLATHAVRVARYRVMQKLKRFAELVQKDPAQNYLLHNIIGIYDPAFYTRYGVHAYLFGGAIAGASAALRPMTCISPEP